MCEDRHHNSSLQIEMTIFLSTKLSIEGPIRLKEEYIEGVFETPSVNNKSIPEQLKGALQQAAVTLEQISVPIQDILANGVKIPLSKSQKPSIILTICSYDVYIRIFFPGILDYGFTASMIYSLFF